MSTGTDTLLPELPVPPPPEEDQGRPSLLGGFFSRHGQEMRMESNRPMLLDQADKVYFVLRGRVDLFTTAVESGHSSGPRSHFLSAEPGSLLFGIDGSGQNHGFLAVGGMGTTVIELPVPTLQAGTQSDQISAELVEAIERWVGDVGRRATRGLTLPQADVKLKTGVEASIAAGQIATSRKGAAWIYVRTGDAFFLDTEELDFSGANLIFPVTPDTWVEFNAASEFTCYDTATCIGHSALWEGLSAFHLAVCQSEFISKALLQVDENIRLHSKEEYRGVARDAALREVASVMRPELRAVGAESGGSGQDFLFAACQLVGEHIGVVIRQHPEAHKLGAKADRLGVIVRASRIRSRMVGLRDDWWNREHGAMLGYLAAPADPSADPKNPPAPVPQDPVALIPRNGGYELINPATGERRRVTRETARGLYPFAQVFYRPFKDGILTVMDVVKFGSRGLAGDAIRVMLMGCLMGVLATLTPLFSGQIFDTAIPGAEKGTLIQFGIALLSGAFAAAAYQVVRSLAVLRIEGRMDYSVQAALWDRLLNLPSTFFRKYAAGDLADRTAGIDSIRSLVSGVGVTAILGAVTSVFYLFVMFKFSAMMGLAAIGLVLVAMILTAAANYAQLRHQRDESNIRGFISGLVLQFLTGVSKIRVAGAEDHALKVWARNFGKQKRIAWTIGRIENFVTVFNAGYPVLCTLTIFATLVQVQTAAEGGGEPITTGSFIAFNTAFGSFLAAMLGLSRASMSMLAVVPVWERLKPILLTSPELGEDRMFPGELTGQIDLYHVNFRYDPEGPLILQNVSLSIRPGEFVAFVGPSGSGKSTLLRVLLGFEVPESGKAFFDGQDLQTLDLREVRQRLGVVLQTSRLAPTTIFQNIIGPNTSLTLEDAWAAAEGSGLADDVRGMPMGMQTVISEGGGTFSGGQKQRLMIARAIVNRPRILFFDEATSALDNQTQKMVTNSLDAMHATRIVIAHRLSTIANADRIVVLVKGRVVENGTYDELIKLNGHFAELARRQVA
ncbi:MAG: NHLP bacteriocin export ABC transporter permease/ATPase subunit [Verrucomicrobiota bacterium]